MKRDEPKLTATDRRGFLRGVVAASSSVALLGGALRSGVANASPEAVTGQPKGTKGYQVTQHVLDYYRTASF